MSIPTHRDDCETRTWKTTCHDCGRPVWFLCCTCGSKVYFDTLGYPWHLHMDSCPVYFVRQMIDEGHSARVIRSLVDSLSIRLGKPVPKEVDALLNTLGAGGKRIIRNILPDPVPVNLKGIVKRNDRINLFKRLNISDNMINRKIMGKFAAGPYSEIVIHQINNGDHRHVNQWVFLIPCEDLDGCGIRLGLEVDVELEAQTIYEDEVFWVAKSIDWK